MARRISIALLAVGLCWIALGCDGDRPAPLQTQAPLVSIKGSDTGTDLTPVSAADREKAIERLNSAIIAHGGAAALSKFQTVIYRGEGVLRVFGIDYTAEQEMQLRFPDHLRFTHTLAKDTGKDVIAGAVRPSGAWIARGELTELREPEQIEDLRNELYLLRVRTLSPLKNEEFVLRPIAQIEIINKKPAEGIRIDHKGRPSIGLYFDSQSHLLVRMVAPAWREAGSIQRREIDFFDFSQTDGLMLPKVQSDRRDGRDYAYWKDTTYRFPAKIDDSAFEKP